MIVIIFLAALIFTLAAFSASHPDAASGGDGKKMAIYGHSAAASGGGTKTSALLPDPRATPGAARLTSASAVCSVKWGRDARHVTPKMKRQVCVAYGVTSGCPGPKYEVDHLISRELGGADAVSNLWPQPYAGPGAHEKDRIENWLHRQVCAGKMPLAEAQKKIRDDWYAAYQQMLSAEAIAVSGEGKRRR